jgi:hypothetical protein
MRFTAMSPFQGPVRAHLDDLKVMDIPFLDRAQAAVEFYPGHVVQREATSGDLAGLPTDLADYYKHRFSEAEAMFDRCGS